MGIIRMKPTDTFDGTFRDRCWMEGDTFVRQRTQPARNATMEEIKTIRSEGALQKQPEAAQGRWTLSVPKADYWNLVAANPDLKSPDAEVMDRAWRKFSASAESLAYRVTTPTTRRK